MVGVSSSKPISSGANSQNAKSRPAGKRGGFNLIAGCATDIMLSNVQFVLKIVDDDNITRVFPGIEGMEVKYHRCRL